MHIVWKSGVGPEQINDRLRKGVSKIELHLNECDLDNVELLEANLDYVRERIEIVHIPISDKYGIEGLNSEENKAIIHRTFELAQRISNGERIIDVVVHQTLALDRLNIWGLYDKIVKELEVAFKKYPNIRINLENLTIMGLSDLERKEGIEYKFCRDSYFDETLKLCEELRKDLKTDRVGLVWDVCHGVSTNRLMKSLIEQNYTYDISEEQYVKTYLPYLNVIHLANTKGLGYAKGEHGTTFDTEEELEDLKHIIRLIIDNNYQGKVTLEVWEEDYTDVKNCVILDKQVKDILNNIN